MVLIWTAVAHIVGVASLYGWWLFKREDVLESARNTGFTEGFDRGKHDGEALGFRAASKELASQLRVAANKMDSFGYHETKEVIEETTSSALLELEHKEQI